MKIMPETMNNSAVVIDLETSGTNPFRHSVLSVGMVPLSASVHAKMVYVRPPTIVWNEFALNNFKKFSDEWEANAISPSEACSEIEEYLSGSFSVNPVTPIGHNIGFDVAFLRQLAFMGGREQLAGLSHRSIDTHTLLYLLHLQGRIPSSARGSDGAFNHFGIEVPDEFRHTALADAFATRDLFARVLEMLLESKREFVDV
jgi:DNA polymerase III epsilon subunit-like protein